jgi:flagellar biosynthesis protein FlhF
MNEVKTFQAATMQLALDLVREELGTDAVILHTKQTSRRRFLPWKKRRQQVEITASVDVNIRRPAATPAPMPTRSAVASVNAAGTPRSRSRSMAADILQELDSSQASFVLSQLRKADEPVNVRPSLEAPSIAAAPDASQEEFSLKLDTIQRMLQDLERTSRAHNAEEIPSELFNLYTELIDSEVEDDLARKLVFQLKETATSEQLADTSASRMLLAGMVERQLRCGEPITLSPNRRKVVALVGPTGVGKTTTIAKLAANFRLRDNVKMGLVTVDTYRIAAVEQLRTYAEIIDLPMRVVTSPQEMRRALDELSGLDLILIDTAGRSPRDELQIKELKRLLAEADVDEVHLVLSLTSSLKSLETTARTFAVADTSSLILTKLDEAAGMGAMLSLSQKVQLPISYVTTGQDVPDDIEPAHVKRLSRLILGQEKIDH